MSTIRPDEAIARGLRVREVVIERGWSAATAEALAEELAVSTRTVRREWARVQRWGRLALEPDEVEGMLFDQLMRLEETIHGAIRAGRYGDAVRGELLLGLLVGTIAPSAIADLRRC